MVGGSVALQSGGDSSALYDFFFLFSAKFPPKMKVTASAVVCLNSLKPLNISVNVYSSHRHRIFFFLVVSFQMNKHIYGSSADKCGLNRKTV